MTHFSSTQTLTNTNLTSRPILDTSDQGLLGILPALFIGFGSPELAITKCTMSNTLHRVGQNLPKPKAIIVLSANWQSSKLEISNTANPLTWHDFSQENSRLYEIDYPAKGHVVFAESLIEQLHAKNIPCSLNPIKALDNGVWVPLLKLYPQADIPVVQLSLPHDFSSYECYQLGAMFASLRQEQILLIGTGSMATINKTNALKTWFIRQLKQDIPTALDWQSYPTEQNCIKDTSLLPLFFALGAGQRMSVVHQSRQVLDRLANKENTEAKSSDMDILRFD